MKEEEELERLCAEINEAARVKREDEKAYLNRLYAKSEETESNTTRERYEAKERETTFTESIVNPNKGAYIPCEDMKKMDTQEALFSANE